MTTIRFAAVTLLLFIVAVGFAVGQEAPVSEPTPSEAQGDAANPEGAAVNPMSEPAPDPEKTPEELAAEKVAAERREAVTVAGKKLDPQQSLHRLASDTVAARVGLTDAQRAEVQRLLNLRSQELSRAPEPQQWAAIIEKSEQQLYDVMTPAQKAIWPKVFEEKTIIFSFRGQAWRDVLYWFADQLALQLVMDAPPPGSFDFSSRQEYTPSEAIDLLNSVLQTKGYTLIRNDRMLMLFDLSRGAIPVQFLPKLRPEELPDRGRFEYTTVVFPLERRNRADVLQAIEPFKGTYCKVVPMPGNSLMITDTASTLLVLEKVIASVENPPPPRQPDPPPPPPPPPVWKTYKVEKNDPTKIETIFKEFASNAKILRIGNSRELHVQLPEPTHTSLAAILEMLENDSGLSEDEPALATYSLDPLVGSAQQAWRLARRSRMMGGQFAPQTPIPFQSPSPFQQPFDTSMIARDVIAILKQTFPAAIVSETPAGNNIVVLAPKADQEKIKTFFESLKQTTPPEDDPVVKLYKFTDPAKKISDEMIRPLRTALPFASLSLDEQQGQLLVIATAKEHETVSQAVAELEAAALPTEGKLVVAYPMSQSVATRFTSLFRQIAQNNKELVGAVNLHDTKQNHVTIWATAAQHEIVGKLIDEISGRKHAPKGSEEQPTEPTLRVFPLDYASGYMTQVMLANIVPNADFSYDPRINAVVAHATPDILEIVEKAVAELDKSTGLNVAIIPVKQELAPEVRVQLYRSAPNTVFFQGRRTMQVIATGPKAELDKIRAVLAAAEGVSRLDEQMIVHTFNSASPYTAVAVLAELFPELRPTVNAAANQIVVQVLADQKELVESLFTQLDGDLEFVPLTKEISAEMLTTFRTIAPRATVIVDRENAQVMVQGPKPDVEKIKKIIESSEKSTAIPEEIYVHTFRQAYPHYVMTILQTVYPEVKAAGYPTHNQLAVRMRPEMRDKVLKLFDELDGEIEFVPLKRELPPELVNSFHRIAPYAVVLVDQRNLHAMIYGPKPDVEKVKKIIATSESAAPLDEEILVYTFKSAAPHYALAVLREIFPDIRIASHPTTNQLTLRVRPERKEQVQKLLDDMDGDIVFVPLKKELSPELVGAFPRIAPAAVVIVDNRNSLAMVYGTKPDVEKIQKMITTSEAALELNEEVIVHNLRNVESRTVLDILREIHPEAKIKDDPENDRLVIRVRPDKKDAVLGLLTQLDVADPDKEKRYFKAYPLDTGFYSLDAGYSHYTPVNFIQDLQKVVPKAKISFDRTARQLIVWGTEEEHKAIDAAVNNLSGDANKKEYGRFQPRRMYAHYLIPVIQRLFPTVISTYEYYSNTIIIEGHPKLIEKVKAMLDELDPAEPSPSDPVVRFYTLNAEPTPTLVQGLLRLVPTAMIVPEKEAKQIMVVAKPDEQKIIEGSVDVILSTYTAPEEPMLFIYPATQEQRETLQAFILTAAADLKGVRIVPDRTPNRVSIWAKPSEHQLIAAILKQMEDSKANEPLRQLKVFQMSIGDLTTAQELLKVSHPEAALFIDRTGNRLLVWATTDELENVTQTLTAQGNLDNRQMLAYPVAGARPETLMQVIKDVFTGLKITPEPQTKRLLVWAMPEEHVKIAEIVEQANKKEDPNSELAEKFVAYSSAQLNPATILNLFRALIPDADVYADPTADKITVRARAREHVQIKDLLEQLRQKDDKLRPILKVYPIGEADPVMIEALLRSQLPDAESMSPDDIVRLLGSSYFYERFYRMYYPRSTVRKIGYFKIDPQTQSVFVFVNADDQEEVAKAIEQIVAAGNVEGIKPVVKRYTLDEMNFYDVNDLLRRIAPSALLEPIFTYTPTEGGRFSWTTNYRDFLAYTREAEHEKIEALVKELNDRAGVGRKEMLSITLPEGTKYPRQQIVDLLRRLYPDLNPMPGAAANQILVWAPKHRLERVQQVVNEACRPLADDQQTEIKSYPLKYIGVDEATAWLKAIFPNVSFDPQLPATLPGQPLPPELQRRRFQRPDDAKVIVAIATPPEHIEIAKTLQELDRDLPETHKMVPKFYGLDDLPERMFYSMFGSLYRAFPNAVITPDVTRQTMLIVATEDEHTKIAGFVQSFKDDREERRPYLEVYHLKNLFYNRVATLINRVAPSAFIIPGAKPEQIGVWGTPKEHLDVSAALTKLETTSTAESTQSLKLFKVGGKKATTAVSLLQYQFPNALTFAVSSDEILSWGSPADHLAIAEMLETVAEAFPDPMLKTYTFKHVPLGQGYLVLRQIYPIAEAAITQRTDTGDLIVSATLAIHEKIARDIAAFDVPRPADVEKMPVAYDLSDMPSLQVSYAVQSMRAAIPETIILPSGVPGQLVVWGRPSEQDKVRAVVDQMLAELPSNTSRMEVYAIRRGSVLLAQQTIRPLIPTVQFGAGLNPNQLLVWAKDSDHTKIKSIIDKLNEPEADVAIEAYSLKNINLTAATVMISNLVQAQGLDVRTTRDPYNNQLIVYARPEDHAQIKELLDKLRTEERDVAVFPLQTLDPITAYRGIEVLFIDETVFESPYIQVDQDTNMLFIQGTKEQLERIRRILIEMGETQLHRSPQTEPGGVPLGPAGRSPMRIIRIQGDASEAIRELEKLWPQYQPNRLLINRPQEPGTSAQEPGTSAPGLPEPSHSLFSIDDPIVPGRPVQAADVYVTPNEDGSVTVLSHDTEALDRLELLLKRINDRVVFEGRDYTVYSVRNISASMVAQRLQLILAVRLTGQQQRFATGYTARFQPPQLAIQADEPTNTIYVRGSRAERTEVANLIAMLDVSELPGERIVRKPIKVPIKNTEASRVQQQILSVYRQKIMMTRLPGGVVPSVIVDNITNSLDIIAPEPLLTELREYAEELDRRTVDEPARKIHVIPLEIKGPVVRQAIETIRRQSMFGNYPYGYGQPMMYPGMMAPGMMPMYRGMPR